MERKYKAMYDVPQDNRDFGDTGEQRYTYINGLGFLPESPQQQERKQLIMQYNILLFSILLLYLLRVIATIPVIRFLAVLGFNVTVNPLTGLVTLSAVAYQTSNILCYMIYMYFPAALILLFSRRSISVKKMFSVPFSRTIRYGVPILIGVSLVAQMLSQAFNTALKSSGLLLFQNGFEAPHSTPAFVLYLVAVTVLPAFFEEFLFRGVVLQSMRRFGDLIAVVVPAVLFMLVQNNAVDMVRTFLIGLAFGYFALRSGSLWVCMLANFLVRCLSVFCWVINSSLPERQAGTVVWFLLSAILLACILVFCRFMVKDPNAFRIRMEDTYLTNRTKIKHLFTNFVFWMVVILAASSMLRSLEIVN